MSSPSLPGDDASRATSAASPGPDPRAPDQVAAEIQAEITDHLATAAERHQATGLSEAESREKAQQAFGDVREIGRRCYWIKQGDSLMFRGAIALLLVVLAVSLAAVTVRSWQAESRMAEQIGALTAQLKELADRPTAPLAAAAPSGPIEIKGRMFVGSPDRPAAGVPLSVINVSDGKLVRKVVSDSQGSFTSGPLADGDLALLAPMPDGRLSVQSAPILAYSGVQAPRQDMDLAFRFGRLGLTLSRPLPEFEVEGRGKYESRILIRVQTPRIRARIWTVNAPLPPEWPIFIDSRARSADGQWYYEILDNAEVIGGLAGTLLMGDEGQFPSGECLVVATVMANNPQTGEPPVARSQGGFSMDFHALHSNAGPYALRAWSLDAPPADYFWIRHHIEGQRRQEEVRNQFEHFGDATKVPITAGAKTLIRIEVPDDLEAQVRATLESTTPAPEAPVSAPFNLRAKITVVGSEPLPAAASD
ncbi:MAG: permease prefix domain 1-containing protein [Planctomycetaceae bacterium]|nr:permease prefix domain 1-containing protein [Planctomycetaceae bacterium]